MLDMLMVAQHTLSIIKPDAVRNKNIGNILKIFEENELNIVTMKMIHLTSQQAAQFYYEHKNRAFFKDLCDFISSGKIVLQVLYGENAIELNRKLMGATNPADAEAGTIRALYAKNIDENSVHGSDSEESAAQEIKFFFPEIEVKIF